MAVNEDAGIALDPPPPFPAELGEFGKFCERLRSERGIPIGVDQQVRLASLLQRLQAGGVVLDSAELAAGYMTPLLARSRDEQETVATLIQALWHEEPTIVSAVSARPRAREPAAETENKLVEESVRRRREWVLLPAFGFAVAIAAWLANWLGGTATNGNGVPKPDDGPTPPPSPTLDIVLQVIADAVTSTGGQIFLVIAGLLGIVALLWRRERRMGVLRDFTFRNVAPRKLYFDRGSWSLFQGGRSHTAATEFARHIEIPSTRIDVRHTIDATIKSAGALDVRYSTVPRLPEYQLWVDRASHGDHMGLFAEDLTRKLRERNLFVSRFDYYGAPGRLRAIGARGGDGETVLFESLIARAPGQRLILLTDTRNLFDRIGRAPQGWLKRLSPFAARIILTPASEISWTGREATLAAMGFDVAPADEAGLLRIARTLTGEDAARPVTVATRHGDHEPGSHSSDSASLAYFERRKSWLSEIRPGAEEQKDLVARLQNWLSEEAFELFAAAAVYPEVSPQLTRMIGQTARDRSGAVLLNEDRLGELARLPWFRLGRIPVWLREAVLACVAEDRRAALETAVHTVLLKPAKSGSLSLEVVAQNRWTVADMLSALLPGDARARRDGIFLRSLRRGAPGRPFEVSRAFVRSVMRRSSIWDVVILAAAGLAVLATPWIFQDKDALARLLKVFEDLASVRIFGQIGIFTATYVGGLALLLAGYVQARWLTPARGLLAIAVALATVGVTASGVSQASLFGDSVRGWPISEELVAALATFIVSFYAGRRPLMRRARSLANLFSGDRWWLSTPIWAYVCGLVLARGATFGLGPVEVVTLDVFTVTAVTLAVRARIGLKAADVFALVVIFSATRTAVDAAQMSPLLAVPNFSAVDEGLLLALALCAFYLQRLGSLTAETLKAAGAGLVVSLALFALAASVSERPPVAPFALLALLPLFTALKQGSGNFSATIGMTAFRFWSGSPKRLGFVILAIIAISAWPVLMSDPADAMVTVAEFLGLVALWPLLRLAYPELRRPPPPGVFAGYEWARLGRRRVWLLAPVLFVLGFTYQTGPYSWDISVLLLPIAVWLGARHGRLGFIVFAVSAAPVLVRIGFEGFGTSWWAGLGFYFASLLLCRFAGMPVFRHDCLKASWLTNRQIIFLFVGLAAALSYENYSGNFDFYISTAASEYVYVMLFLIGISRIPFSRFGPVMLLTWGIAFVALSFSTEAHFASIGGFRMAPVFGQASYLISFCAFFALGRATRRILLDPRALDRYLVALALLCLLAYLLDDFRVDYRRTFDNGVELRPRLDLVSAYLPFVLLFFLGIVGGVRGIAIGFAVLFLVMVAIPVGLSLVLGGGDVPYAMNFRDLQFGAFFGEGELTVRWDPPQGIVGPEYAMSPGWTIGFGDWVALVFGWRLRAALLARGEPSAEERAALTARFRLGPAADLPALRVLWIDRLANIPGWLTLVWAALLIPYSILAILFDF